ncbi:MAG: hypothetical protein P4L22_02440 [Candidatus Babeliales bacterium]|nr:hypothetical protein [Candidatus Babeliales bacterium]
MKKFLFFSFLFLLSNPLVSSEHQELNLNAQDSSDYDDSIKIGINGEEEASSPEPDEVVVHPVSEQQLVLQSASSVSAGAAANSVQQIDGQHNAQSPDPLLSNDSSKLLIHQQAIERHVGALEVLAELKQDLESKIAQVETNNSANRQIQAGRIKALEDQLVLVNEQLAQHSVVLNKNFHWFKQFKKKFKNCCLPACLKISRLFDCCKGYNAWLRSKQAEDQE